MTERYALRATLRDVAPDVVRAVRIPTDYSAYELHLCLQVAFGWQDLADFEVEGAVATVGTEQSYLGIGLVHDGRRYLHADEVTVADLFERVGSRATYRYDFGARWEVALELTGFDYSADGLPECTRADAAAPPDGGVDGPLAFEAYKIAFAEPGHPLHDRSVSVLGTDFDPAAADELQISLDLIELFGEPDDGEDDGDAWWDPSRYDDGMRLRVLREEIEGQLPPDLAARPSGQKHEALLAALRGVRDA